MQVKVVDVVSLKVVEGEICVFFGFLGCGKIIIFKMINCLINLIFGCVLFNGQDIFGIDEVELCCYIGYVIQQIGLFFNMIIEENIIIVLCFLGWDKKCCQECVIELMVMVVLDLKKFFKCYLCELFGGQQQCIGVICVLVVDVLVLLMDELFGVVDLINCELIQNEFFQMQCQLNKIVIMVSYDIDEVIKLGDKVVVFCVGKLVQFDNLDILLV